MKKTISSLLIVILLLSFCSCTVSESAVSTEAESSFPTEFEDETKMSTEHIESQAEENPTEPVPDETEEMTRPAPRAAGKTATVTLAEEGSHTCRICTELHHYRIPYIEITPVDYEKQRLTNEEIYDTLFAVSKGAIDVDYTWWRTDDVLTVLVELKTNGGEHDGVPVTGYRVFNIDIYDGHIMSFDEMLKNAGLSKSDFDDLALKALLNGVYASGAIANNIFSYTPEDLPEELYHMTYLLAIDDGSAIPFWGQDGRLWVLGPVLTLLAGSGFAMRTLPLTDYDLDPQFIADFPDLQ